MKRITMSLAAMVLMATLSVPALAQDDKAKSKDKESKKQPDQIIITRKNVTDEKVVIEIVGDKVTINGKDASEIKDGNVSVHRSKSRFHFGEGSSVYTPGNGQWNDLDFNNGLFSMNQNHAMLGVVTEDAEKGVEINEVTKESAAAKAGLKSGDVITKINDKEITSPDQLSQTIRAQKPGDKVTVTYLRDKKEQTVSTELGQFKGVQGFNKTMEFPELKALENYRTAPNVGTRREPFNGYQWMTGGPKLGLSVQDTDDGKGVKVIEVDEDSHAAKAGVKEDDVITHINDVEVNGADQVAKIVKENKEKPSIRLQLKRNGKSQNIEVKMPRKIKTADL
jgi:serine protease Do